MSRGTRISTGREVREHDLYEESWEELNWGGRPHPEGRIGVDWGTRVAAEGPLGVQPG